MAIKISIPALPQSVTELEPRKAYLVTKSYIMSGQDMRGNILLTHCNSVKDTTKVRFVRNGGGLWELHSGFKEDVKKGKLALVEVDLEITVAETK